MNGPGITAQSRGRSKSRIPGGAGEDDATGDIVVNDPAICAFLDAFYHLIVDPERFGTAEFGTTNR